MSAPDARESLHIAIIGGGVTGLSLALGLQARHVQYTIFERAAGFREIGAGLGFSANAERAMNALDPEMLAAYKRVANPNGEDYFQWVDGCSESNEIIYKLYVGEDGFQGCRRSDFLDEVSKMVPPSRVRFEKQLESLEEQANGKVLLTFKDGTTAEADVVAGCDGIRSRVRQVMLGENSAAAHPSYTNKFCFRALIPMDKAVASLGTYRPSTRFMYNGPDAHIITYPIGMGTVLNTLAVISDPNPWKTFDGKHTAHGNKSEAIKAFAKWNPTVRAIVDLLPDEMDKWAVFDMRDHPAPSYTSGIVCLAGDAAHAIGPHLGAGAGMGIEDAVVLSSVLHAVQDTVAKVPGRDMATLCRHALSAYDEIRYERTQAVVESTRVVCDLFQWRDAERGRDHKKFASEITQRFHAVWDLDIDAMVKDANELFLEMSQGG